MTVLLTLTRAVHFGSCLILESVFPLLFLVAIPAWNRVGGETLPARERFQRLLQRLLAICLLAGVLSGFLWLWLAVASMSGSGLWEALQPSLFGIVLTQTPPGRVWLLRGAFALVFAAGLFFGPAKSKEGKVASAAGLLCALSAVLLTASLAWLGHAGAGEGPQLSLQLGGDLLHLVAAGVWPAGLVPFAIFLACFLEAREPAMLLAASEATRRFSALSVLMVALLALSGVANSYFLVRTPQALVSTEYGRLLLLKISLFGATACIGAWNLFKLKPRLAVAAGSLPAEAHHAALAGIGRNVLIEIGLGTLVLLVTALLGITPPAHS